MDEGARNSRRTLMAAGLGGIVAWMASAFGRATPAQADGEQIVVGGFYDTATESTVLQNKVNVRPVIQVLASANPSGMAVYGFSNTFIALQGVSNSAAAVAGSSTSSHGVYGTTAATGGLAAGVYGYAARRWGVYGESITDVGVRASSRDFIGAYAQSTNGDGIQGVAIGSKRGVWGESAAGTGVYGFSGPYQTGGPCPARDGRLR